VRKPPRRLLLTVGFGLAAFTSLLAADRAGAKILFYDPDIGQPSQLPVKPDTVTGLAPVRTRGTQFVGVHYWFENERGQKFAEPGAAGLGARVRMHLRGNAQAFLTVWMRDSSRDSLELTSRTHGGPEGRWSGYELYADTELVVPGEFEITTADRAAHIIFLLARSQTEQVQSFANCRAKLDAIAARQGADGESVIVREVDRTTRGQVGTYVVHRMGGQAGEEFSFAVGTGGTGRH
jgi:hypothetical protein